MNLSSVVHAVIESRLATLHELQTYYSLADLWLLFESHAVSQHNEYEAMKRSRKS